MFPESCPAAALPGFAVPDAVLKPTFLVSLGHQGSLQREVSDVLHELKPRRLLPPVSEGLAVTCGCFGLCL